MSRKSFLSGFIPLASAVICAAAVGCAAKDEPAADASEAATNNLETARAADAGAAPNGPVATAMADELTSLGLNLSALPKLHDLDPDTLSEVMQTFTRALGVRCSGCHDTSDFAKPTKQKTIATHMWDDFVRGVALKDGSGAMYCDSCHQGKAKFLNRNAPLRSWMTANFVDKLKRTDGATHNCATCHGSPFQGDIFENLWNAQ